MTFRNLSILGSTGSIGRNALRIAEMHPDRFGVKALAARRNVDLLARQIERFNPEIAAVFDEETAAALAVRLGGGRGTEILFGDDGYRAVATHEAADIFLSAPVGAAGLLPALAAIRAGKDIALANKETLVMAGDLVMTAAAEHDVKILPVDSEHSAIFQCLACNRREDAEKIFLTASGGPFRKKDRADFDAITAAEALNHPTWAMGPKITIDSATLMNKGLEVIEAVRLFDMPADRIEVVVHPQSIVHSMVAFKDGSVMAQMGVPDMKGAIACALSWPERLDLQQPAPDFSALGALTFEPPDLGKFPCLRLAFAAVGAGGTLPAVLNAANEVAVQAFLDDIIPFTRIPELIEEVMMRHDPASDPDLETIMDADRRARESAGRMLKAA